MNAGGLKTRWRLWRAAPRSGPRAIAWQPEPRGAGSASKGRQILAGVWHLAGEVIEAPGASPWDLTPASTPFEMLLHGQGWLDDVIATGEREAQERARGWVVGWARSYGGGRGPGWAPALTGRRLLRWISQAPVLLSGMGPEDQKLFFDAIYAQSGYLARHWSDAVAGLPRMEALTGLLYAGLTLEGQTAMAGFAADALARALEEDVDEAGGIPARNPEALLEVAVLLDWAIEALAARGDVPAPLRATQARIVATLRALSHSDGGLARFHGGGPGREGRLARVLSSAAPSGRRDGLAMGFLPVSHGRTTLVVDAAPPPVGPISGSAHASTLAFELSSGPCPVIVNCGAGGAFGPDWHRAGRATASHSTLSLDGWSTARIGPLMEVDGRRIAPLVQPPAHVQHSRAGLRDATAVTLSHDGYGPGFGLVHLRRLVLSSDGRTLQGEDALRAVGAADKERLEDARAATRRETGTDGLPFSIRFHLHPDAEAGIDMGGRAISIALPSGEVWVFRPGLRTGESRGVPVVLSLEPSVYMDTTRLHPRPSFQMVLSGRVLTYAAAIDWTLTRAQEAPGPGALSDDHERPQP